MNRALTNPATPWILIFVAGVVFGNFWNSLAGWFWTVVLIAAAAYLQWKSKNKGNVWKFVTSAKRRLDTYLDSLQHEDPKPQVPSARRSTKATAESTDSLDSSQTEEVEDEPYVPRRINPRRSTDSRIVRPPITMDYGRTVKEDDSNEWRLQDRFDKTVSDDDVSGEEPDQSGSHAYRPDGQTVSVDAASSGRRQHRKPTSTQKVSGVLKAGLTKIAEAGARNERP